MRILDSNIIIYATQTAHANLLPLLYDTDSYVSEITKLEVLGYHGFDDETQQNMTELFETLQIINVNSIFINKAIELRQLRKMSIGDSIIAATALLKNYEVNTRNVSDFNWITSLVVINPFKLI